MEQGSGDDAEVRVQVQRQLAQVGANRGGTCTCHLGMT